ncbi:hypothetical protein ABK040_010457 [Willaertia magna]
MSTSKSPLTEEKQAVEKVVAEKNNDNSGETPNVGVALYEKGRQFLELKEAKINKEREKIQQKGVDDLTFKPEISKKAKKITRESNCYEYNNKWRERVDSEIEEMRQRKLREEEEQNLAKTIPISEVSKTIIKKKQEQKEYIGPISGWEKRVDEYKHLKETTLEEEFDYKPKINERSLQLAKHAKDRCENGNTFERLYNIAVKKKLENEHNKSTENNKSAEHHKNDNISVQGSDASDIHEKLRRSADHLEFWKKLFDKQAEVDKKKAKLKEYEDHKHSFHPKINANSIDLAKHATRSPLYTLKKNEEDSFMKGSLSPRGKMVKPKKKFEISEFIQRRLNREKQKEDKLKQMKQNQREEEMKECTFKPNINQKSLELANLWIQAFENEIVEEYDFSPEIRKRLSLTTSPKEYNTKKPSPTIKKVFNNFSSRNDLGMHTTLEKGWNVTSPIKHHSPKRSEIVEEEKEEFSDDDLLMIEDEMQSCLEEWSKLESSTL